MSNTNENLNCPAFFEDIPKDDELCREKYALSYLHFVLLFRRFYELDCLLGSLSDAELSEKMNAKGTEEYPWLTPSVCALWNLDYITAYDEKFGTAIRERLISACWKEGESSSHKAIMEYTDPVYEKKSVFDIIWGNTQPMLDVVYYEKQKIASQQVKDHGFSIVLDEVGTGKTVTALYAIRDMIEECNRRKKTAKILIVCPYNKRSDWQNDLRRQLGRYAHIVEQSDDGSMYHDCQKKAFFYNGEQQVFICGPKQSTKDKDGSYSALKKSLEQYSAESFRQFVVRNPWDLVIIDEVHLYFANYKAIRGERVMLLTATPIIANSKYVRSLREYIDLANKIILYLEDRGKRINPIENREPDERDGFVNWFREDMGRESVRRNIVFVECERAEWRHKVFSEIYRSKGMLTALAYDQDDEYLLYSAKRLVDKGEIEVSSDMDLPKHITGNYKLQKLIELLREKNRIDKSYIIFCEHTRVARRVYESLRNEKGLIAAIKTGKEEEQVGLNNIREGQLLDSLILAIRAKRRVVLVLTGKIGGTGLNLGEFDGVIHYELPYTSIELEQRYGRVDRINAKNTDEGKRKEKEMIFLLNKCGADEYDMEANRMLYYCTTKIDIACQYMPIRNTILFYPDMIKREYQGIMETLRRIQALGIWEHENSVIECNKQLSDLKKVIQNDGYWKQAQKVQRSDEFTKMCQDILNAPVSSEEGYEGLCGKIEKYLELEKEFNKINDPYQSEKRRFLREKDKALAWLRVVGIAETNEDSDIFFANDERLLSDENAENANIDQEQVMQELLMEMDKTEEKTGGEKSVSEQINEFICRLQQVDLSAVELSGEGVFWYDKLSKKIQRATVEAFRGLNNVD